MRLEKGASMTCKTTRTTRIQWSDLNHACLVDVNTSWLGCGCLSDRKMGGTPLPYLLTKLQLSLLMVSIIQSTNLESWFDPAVFPGPSGDLVRNMMNG